MIYQYLNTIVQKCKIFIQQDRIEVTIKTLQSFYLSLAMSDYWALCEDSFKKHFNPGITRCTTRGEFWLEAWFMTQTKWNSLFLFSKRAIICDCKMSEASQYQIAEEQNNIYPEKQEPCHLTKEMGILSR